MQFSCQNFGALKFFFVLLSFTSGIHSSNSLSSKISETNPKPPLFPSTILNDKQTVLCLFRYSSIPWYNWDWGQDLKIHGGWQRTQLDTMDISVYKIETRSTHSVMVLRFLGRGQNLRARFFKFPFVTSGKLIKNHHKQDNRTFITMSNSTSRAKLKVFVVQRCKWSFKEELLYKVSVRKRP